MRDLLDFLRSRTFFIQVLLAVFALIGIVYLTLGWIKGYTRHGEFVEVPDFSRMTVPEMRRAAEGAGLRFQVDTTDYNPDFPRFSILKQDPLAGTQVKENRKIYLKVNPAGYKEVTVPDVIQVTRRNAESRLRAVGLDIDRVTYIDDFGKDMVIHVKYKGKYVGSGDRLPKTSKLELVCGNGVRPGSAIDR